MANIATLMMKRLKANIENKESDKVLNNKGNVKRRICFTLSVRRKSAIITNKKKDISLIQLIQ